MAFCMATMNEEQRNHLAAVKFYKRLYFCAKILDDSEGSEIALNKIGLCYYRTGNYDKSMIFHNKHF